MSPKAQQTAYILTLFVIMAAVAVGIFFAEPEAGTDTYSAGVSGSFTLDHRCYVSSHLGSLALRSRLPLMSNPIEEDSTMSTPTPGPDPSPIPSKPMAKTRR